MTRLRLKRRDKWSTWSPAGRRLLKGLLCIPPAYKLVGDVHSMTRNELDTNHAGGAPELVGRRLPGPVQPVEFFRGAGGARIGARVFARRLVLLTELHTDGQPPQLERAAPGHAVRCHRVAFPQAAGEVPQHRGPWRPARHEEALSLEEHRGAGTRVFPSVGRVLGRVRRVRQVTFT